MSSRHHTFSVIFSQISLITSELHVHCMCRTVAAPTFLHIANICIT